MKKLPKKLLVIRFSAMGDVALCAPVIDAILEQHPNVEITFLTRPFFKSLFKENKRLHFHFADFKKQHKGFLGLRKLYTELKSQHFDAVIDLHNVLRTQVLRNFFKLSFQSVKIATIKKGRREKKAIVTKKAPLRPLKHTTERYLHVFNEVGIQANLAKKFCLEPNVKNKTPLTQQFCSQKYIVIAPFAAHSSKEWGVDKWKEFLELFYQSDQSKTTLIYFLGGGEHEKKEIDRWVTLFPKSANLTQKYTLEEELFILSHSKCVIAMDSGNMHLASLVGASVISIWGATHPFLGFAPLYNEANIIQANHACRPCSVYGKLQTKEQQECAAQVMQAIDAEIVFQKVSEFL